MEFKKWLIKLEIGDNYGLAPPQQRPDRIVRDQAKKGTGAMPQYDMEPLPGNEKAMKKKQKKKQSKK